MRCGKQKSGVYLGIAPFESPASEYGLIVAKVAFFVKVRRLVLWRGDLGGF